MPGKSEQFRSQYSEAKRTRSGRLTPSWFLFLYHHQMSKLTVFYHVFFLPQVNSSKTRSFSLKGNENSCSSSHSSSCLLFEVKPTRSGQLYTFLSETVRWRGEKLASPSGRRGGGLYILPCTRFLSRYLRSADFLARKSNGLESQSLVPDGINPLVRVMTWLFCVMERSLDLMSMDFVSDQGWRRVFFARWFSYLCPGSWAPSTKWKQAEAGRESVLHRPQVEVLSAPWILRSPINTAKRVDEAHLSCTSRPHQLLSKCNILCTAEGEFSTVDHQSVTCCVFKKE